MYKSALCFNEVVILKLISSLTNWASTLPDLEGQLKVLSPPNQEAWQLIVNSFWFSSEPKSFTRIVSAKRQEVIPIDGKKASGMGGAGVGFASMLTFWRLPLRKFRFLKKTSCKVEDPTGGVQILWDSILEFLGLGIEKF